MDEGKGNAHYYCRQPVTHSIEYPSITSYHKLSMLLLLLLLLLLLRVLQLLAAAAAAASVVFLASRLFCYHYL